LNTFNYHVILKGLTSWLESDNKILLADDQKPDEVFPKPQLMPAIYCLGNSCFFLCLTVVLARCPHSIQ